MARAGDIVCRWSTGEMEEQWGGQEFLGRVEWEGGGFERGKEFLEERESVLSWMVSSVLYFCQCLIRSQLESTCQ